MTNKHKRILTSKYVLCVSTAISPSPQGLIRKVPSHRNTVHCMYPLVTPSISLRHRKYAQVANIEVTHNQCPKTNGQVPEDGVRLGFASSIVFASAYILFVFTGILCAWMPPIGTTIVDNVQIPSDAKCLRASRHADYVSVEANIGSPGRRINVLVRFDYAVDDAKDALRIFESKVLESKSISCNGINSTCFDTIFMTDVQQESGFQRIVSKFGYTAEAAESSIAKTYLNMEGELKLIKGYDYWLTSSHLCFKPNTNSISLSVVSSDNELVGSVSASTNQLKIQDAELAKVSSLKDSFARQVTVDFLCELDTIYFLPVLSNVDQLYLSISDYSFYVSEPDSIRLRRNMVEVGRECASRLPTDKYGADFQLYLLDCNMVNTCATAASLPYRRIAQKNVYVNIDLANKFVARFEDNIILSNLPALSDNSGAVALAVAKLILIIVSASLVWVRADRATSKPHWMIKHCLKTIDCTATPNKYSTPWSLIEDMIMGMFCIVSRFSIAFWRYQHLYLDSQGRACVFEIAASALSLLHWIFRYFVISPSIFEMAEGIKDPNGPLTRLGGSSAILDVTGSVLLAFSEPPTLVSTLSRFEPTARILICALVVMVSLPRCLFSTSCCSLLYESGVLGFSQMNITYRYILLAAACFWLLQLLTLSVTLSDLIITPFAISSARSTIGETFWIRCALFLGALNFGIPRMLSSVVKLRKIV